MNNNNANVDSVDNAFWESLEDFLDGEVGTDLQLPVLSAAAEMLMLDAVSALADDDGDDDGDARWTMMNDNDNNDDDDPNSVAYENNNNSRGAGLRGGARPAAVRQRGAPPLANRASRGSQKAEKVLSSAAKKKVKETREGRNAATKQAKSAASEVKAVAQKLIEMVSQPGVSQQQVKAQLVKIEEAAKNAFRDVTKRSSAPAKGKWLRMRESPRHQQDDKINRLGKTFETVVSCAKQASRMTANTAWWMLMNPRKGLTAALAALLTTAGLYTYYTDTDWKDAVTAVLSDLGNRMAPVAFQQIVWVVSKVFNIVFENPRPGGEWHVPIIHPLSPNTREGRLSRPTSVSSDPRFSRQFSGGEGKNLDSSQISYATFVEQARKWFDNTFESHLSDVMDAKCIPVVFRQAARAATGVLLRLDERVSANDEVNAMFRDGVDKGVLRLLAAGDTRVQNDPLESECRMMFLRVFDSQPDDGARRTLLQRLWAQGVKAVQTAPDEYKAVRQLRGDFAKAIKGQEEKYEHLKKEYEKYHARTASAKDLIAHMLALALVAYGAGFFLKRAFSGAKRAYLRLFGKKLVESIPQKLQQLEDKGVVENDVSPRAPRDDVPPGPPPGGSRRRNNPSSAAAPSRSRSRPPGEQSRSRSRSRPSGMHSMHSRHSRHSRSRPPVVRRADAAIPRYRRFGNVPNPRSRTAGGRPGPTSTAADAEKPPRKSKNDV